MSKSSIDKMIFFIEFLTSTKMKEINIDFMNLISICNIQYSRNIYKKDANWKFVKLDYAFDYDHVLKYNSVSEIEYIRKKINFFAIFF